MADKRYDQFTAGTPTTTRIILHADPSTGALEKCELQDVVNLVPESVSLFQQIQTLGSPIIALSLNAQPYFQPNSGVYTNNLMFFIMVYLPACTVTGIAHELGVSGNFTASLFNGFGLYQLSGTTLTRVAQTANDPNIFKATQGVMHQVPFAATATITAGIYYICYQYSSSAVVSAPQFRNMFGISSPAWNACLMPSNLFMYAFLSGASTLPSSFAAATWHAASFSVPLLGVY